MSEAYSYAFDDTSNTVDASRTNEVKKDSPSQRTDMPSNTSEAPASSNTSHDTLISTAYLGHHKTTATDSAAATTLHATSALTSGSDPISSTTCATINICTSADDGAVGSVGAMSNNTTNTDLIGQNSSVGIDTSIDADIIGATTDDGNIEDLASPPPLDRISNFRGKKKRKDVIQESILDATTSKSVLATNGSNNITGPAYTPKRPKVINLESYESTTIFPTNDGVSAEDSHHSSETSMNSFLKKISTIIPYPIHMPKRAACVNEKLTSFLDVVDLTSKPCCGYLYMLRMVDPVSRYGHVVVLKSMSKDDFFYSFNRLMTVVRVKPHTLFNSAVISFVSEVANNYPSVQFVLGEHNSSMKAERELFLLQLDKWVREKNNWVTGAAVIQAVTNTLPILKLHEDI